MTTVTKHDSEEKWKCDDGKKSCKIKKTSPLAVNVNKQRGIEKAWGLYLYVLKLGR